MGIKELPFHIYISFLDFMEENAQKQAIHHWMQLILHVLSSYHSYLNNGRLLSQILDKILVVSDIVRVAVRVEIESPIRRRSLLNRIDDRGRGGILCLHNTENTTLSRFFDFGSISFVLVNTSEAIVST